MIGNFSSINYWHYQTNNWAEKKSKFSHVIRDSVYTRLNLPGGLGEFESDRGSPRNYADQFLEIFNEEMQQFGRDIHVNEFKVEDIWSVQYKKYDYHPVHTHGRTNFSGVLYFDYIEEHGPTHFVVNNMNNLSNMTDIISPRIQEGDVFIFPSNLLHFTSPNKSDVIRKVIAFDISVKGEQ